MDRAMARRESMTQEDRDHLQLLSIFHYVVAGLVLLMALFPVIHLVMGIGMLAGGIGTQEPIAGLMGIFFVVIAAIFMVATAALGTCMVLAGRNLLQQRRWTFCLVVAAISCLMMPFGTVLGVFTILVLMRPAVKEAFQGSTTAEAAAVAPAAYEART